MGDVQQFKYVENNWKGKAERKNKKQKRRGQQNGSEKIGHAKG